MSKLHIKQTISGLFFTGLIVVVGSFAIYNLEGIGSLFSSLFPDDDLLDEPEENQETLGPIQRRLTNKEQGWGAIFGKKSTKKRIEGQYYIYAFSTPTIDNLETDTLKQGKRKNYYCKWQDTIDKTCIIRKIIWDKTNMSLPINAKAFDKLINNDAISNTDLQNRYFNTFQIEVSQDLFDKFNWLRTKHIEVLSNSHRSFSTLTPIFGGNGPKISGRLNYFVGKAKAFVEKETNLAAKTKIANLKETTPCKVGKDANKGTQDNNWCTFYDLGKNAYGIENTTKLVTIPNINKQSTTLEQDSFYLIKTTQWFDISKTDLSKLVVDLNDSTTAEIKKVRFTRILPIFYLPNKASLPFRADSLLFDNELPIVLLKD